MYKKVLADYAAYMEADVLTIKLNIRRILKERFLKRAYLTSELGIKPYTIGTITNATNKSRPEFMTILTIADHFGVDVNYFLEPITNDGSEDDDE